MAAADPDSARTRRFADFVKAHAFDHQFIDRADERRILQEGVARFGVGFEDGQAMLLGVASANDYTVERNADAHIRGLLAHYAGRRGRIGRRDFLDAVAVYDVLAKGTVPDAEIRRRLKAIMVENGWRPRRYGLLRSRKWYREIKTDPELATLRHLTALSS